MKVGNTRRSHAMALTGVLAGAICGVAQQALAQSVSTSISVYGLIDTMVRYSDNNRGDQSLAELSEGYFSGSRWGVRGNEALGAGWSALFNLESGFDLATGTSLQGTAASNYGQVGTQGTGRLFGRQSYLGIEHLAWGKLTVGRQFTTAYDATFRFQPYGHPNLDAVAILNGYTGPRQDNMAKYAGQWGAFSATAHYTFGEVPGDAAASSSRGLALAWITALIDVGALFQSTSALANEEKRTIWGIGGSSQLGRVKLALGYLDNRYHLSPTRNHVLTGGATVQATPALALSLAAGYDRQTAASGHRLMLTSVAEYSLSRRTSVYAEADFNRISGSYALPAFMGVRGNKFGGGVGLRHRL
ncbi:outer membrane protein [Cupriavidus necator N-1]|uniref:Outer membrane protein n=2 Tax=Cupriavidus necator TaxID=106590 RepID=G0EUS6_CUPNN|nr:outer membrane protein [Cupriavidus necator N-1]